VRALNSIFQQWKISAQSDQWNISGEPCTGAAIDDNIGFENVNYNPFVNVHVRTKMVPFAISMSCKFLLNIKFSCLHLDYFL
jgi:hypothetical protein